MYKCLASLLCFLASAVPVQAGQIDIVQLDLYEGMVGTHPVQVALGNTMEEMAGHYHYGKQPPGKYDALYLHGKHTVDNWTLQEEVASKKNNGSRDPSGTWTLLATEDGWRGTWSKPDGSGQRPVRLNKVKTATDYAILSQDYKAPAESRDTKCMVRIFRQQKPVEMINASNDSEMGCERTDLSFPDLNFDGYADLIYNTDTPAHNYSFALWVFDPVKKRLVDTGSVLTEPQVDPIHRNIAVEIHESCCKHSAEIYRLDPRTRQAKLVEGKYACQESTPKPKTCIGNYWYDRKSGKIVEGDE